MPTFNVLSAVELVLSYPQNPILTFYPFLPSDFLTVSLCVLFVLPVIIIFNHCSNKSQVKWRMKLINKKGR